MLEINTKIHAIVHKFRTHDIIHSGAIFHPLNHSCKHIVGASKRDSCCRRRSALAQNPRPWARVAMEHSRYAKEADEVVELGRGRLHAARKVVVESFGVEAGDLIILTAMIRDEFTAGGLESGEIAGPCSDVRWVELLGRGSVLEREIGDVVGGVIYDVFEPALGRETSARGSSFQVTNRPTSE